MAPGGAALLVLGLALVCCTAEAKLPRSAQRHMAREPPDRFNGLDDSGPHLPSYFALRSDYDKLSPKDKDYEEQEAFDAYLKVIVGATDSDFYKEYRKKYTTRPSVVKKMEYTPGRRRVELRRSARSAGENAKFRGEGAKTRHGKIVKKTYGLTAKDIERKRRDRRQTVTSPRWSGPALLGAGDVALTWRAGDGLAVLRAEVRATGHLALALAHDALLVWLDDNEHAEILDCHLVDGVPMTDHSQDYELVFAVRNSTHLVVEVRRPLDTCDPDDVVLGGSELQVQWAVGEGDPRGAGWLGWRGSQALRLLAPPRAPRPPADRRFREWNIAVNNFEIPENVATMFWCRIVKAPALGRKHHMAGFSVGMGAHARHAVLQECETGGAEAAQWERWAAGPGFEGPDAPREWAACLAPVAAWAVGRKGEIFPEHVGIPFGDPNGVTYYMLEMHYENPSLQKVMDNSTLTILYTPELRPHDAGLMVSGITISALHVLPPGQPKYHSAGYCSEKCTSAMLNEEGINVVSVLLHSHSAGRKLSLRHIRDGHELPKIAEEDNYDSKVHHLKILREERNVRPGDALITECTYDTTDRQKPTLGGYSQRQEMCLAFLLHYPRTPLTGCYSMTPVKEFFETFAVKEFYGSDMKQVENMFMVSGFLDNYPDLFEPGFNKSSKETAVQGDDRGVKLLSQLVIKEPEEFRNKSFIEHLNEIPWSESILTRTIEDTLYKGKHMTFCRKRDDTLAAPIEITVFPTFSEATENPTKQCHYKLQQNRSTALRSSLVFYVLLTTIFIKLLPQFSNIV